MAELIRPVSSGCTTAFSYVKAYLQVSAKAGPSNVISFSCIILIFFFWKFTFIFLACSYTPHSILALVFSPVRHKLQPIGHFRVWDVLHLKQKLTVSAQGPPRVPRLWILSPSWQAPWPAAWWEPRTPFPRCRFLLQFPFPAAGGRLWRRRRQKESGGISEGFPG